jgi:two-component system, NarL family, nitrate/nitrite response regulator NarL
MATATVRQRTLRIAVRSDRRLFRDALAACLHAEQDYDVVGHASDLGDLIALCELRRPEVALVDLCAGVDDALGRLRPCIELAHVVVVYDRLSPAELAALWRLGVDTLVPCSHGLEALLMVLRRYREESETTTRDPAGVATELTDREREIITLVSAGHTVERIAGLLEISTSAVANAKRRIYNKLDVASQTQAVARASVLGIVARPIVRPASRGGPDAPLVSLRGADGPARQRVAAALTAGAIPFADGAGSIGAGSIGAGSVGGDGARVEGGIPSLVVLVDPEPGDWPAGRVPVVLVRSVRPRRTEMIDALVGGAVAVVTVDRVAADLVPALTLATHGYLAVDADAAGALLDALRGPAARTPSLPELTARECDILRSIADGHTVRQTARLLGIAEKTVENTQGHMFRKLGARNRAGALSAAHALGLLELVALRPTAVVGGRRNPPGLVRRDS